MSGKPNYPLRFRPIIKQAIWGDRRLGSVLGKPLGGGNNYAESWEISDHGDDVSVVADGPLAGTTLRDLIRSQGTELLGSTIRSKEQFPLLIKFLDAHQPLSVQVHPNDEVAHRLANDNGKTECWVVIQADPGSVIYAGLKTGVTREQLAKAIDSGTVEPLLHRVQAKAGECILIPAGTVHAIGAGVLLSEIQQMSDTTYRIFDWNRVGPDGKPRALHRDQALESINFSAGPVQPWVPPVEDMPGGTRERLARCSYFALERLRLRRSAAVGRSDRFTILLGLEGAAEVESGTTKTPLKLGQTLLLPAMIGPCTITPQGLEEAIVLTCIVP
jgi:mannose-6-phosphate isomerase